MRIISIIKPVCTLSMILIFKILPKNLSINESISQNYLINIKVFSLHAKALASISTSRTTHSLRFHLFQDEDFLVMSH